MKAIVLGGGSDQCSLIMELKQRGFTTILVDYYEQPPAKALVDKHYRVSTLDQEAVCRIAEDEQADRVVTACIDQALLTVAYVSEKLGLYWPFSYEEALRATNKAFMKQVFKDFDIPTANFITASDEDAALKHNLSYPVVVKPADSNGSFGVRRVNAVTQLQPAIADALRISRSRKAIIEEYVDGTELSVDAFVYDRRVHLLLVTETKKMPSTEGGFPICQSRYPADLSEAVLLKIERAVNRIVTAFDLDNTPLLVQVVVRDAEVFVLEFGARIAGGSKHHLIKHITGFDVMNAFVETLFQGAVDVKTHPYAKHVTTNYIYTNPGVFCAVTGIDALFQDAIVVRFDRYKTPGMKIVSSSASRDRIGAFIVEADDRTMLQKKLDYADRNMKVLNEAGNDIMLHGLFA
jgi:carbamoylphosphate synthase large subunit